MQQVLEDSAHGVLATMRMLRACAAQRSGVRFALLPAIATSMTRIPSIVAIALSLSAIAFGAGNAQSRDFDADLAAHARECVHKQPNALLQAVIADIFSGDLDGIFGKLDGVDLCLGKPQPGEDREAP